MLGAGPLRSPFSLRALNTLLYSIATAPLQTRFGAALVRLVVLGEELVGRGLEHLGRRRTLR